MTRSAAGTMFLRNTCVLLWRVAMKFPDRQKSVRIGGTQGILNLQWPLQAHRGRVPRLHQQPPPLHGRKNGASERTYTARFLLSLQGVPENGTTDVHIKAPRPRRPFSRASLSTLACSVATSHGFTDELEKDRRLASAHHGRGIRRRRRARNTMPEGVSHGPCPQRQLL